MAVKLLIGTCQTFAGFLPSVGVIPLERNKDELSLSACLNAWAILWSRRGIILLCNCRCAFSTRICPTILAEQKNGRMLKAISIMHIWKGHCKERTLRRTVLLAHTTCCLFCLFVFPLIQLCLFLLFWRVHLQILPTNQFGCQRRNSHQNRIVIEIAPHTGWSANSIISAEKIHQKHWLLCFILLAETN